MGTFSQSMSLLHSSHSFLWWFLLSVVSLTSAQTIYIQFAPVSPALNSTDDFLIPLALGSNKQIVNLLPSLKQSVTSIFGPKSCIPAKQTAPVAQCALYRGSLFDPQKSSSFSASGLEFNYKNQIYITYANGPLVNDTVHMSVGNGDWELKDYNFALIESSNMTGGMLGLGRNSTFLQELYDKKKIASKSFGLHVGIDIWNHPWPVLNPTFDESGNKPTTEDDFNTGVGKRNFKGHKNLARKETDEDQLPVRESHKYPGSLILGGYDKSKLSKKTKPLTAPISADGTLQLSLTKIVARNIYPNSPFTVLDKPHKVVIDADTPHMYFPQNISRQIGSIFGAVYGDPGYDFFYTTLADRERYLGNVTMTFKAPDGSGEEINISIPPTVWYQPVGYMRNFTLIGNDFYNYYAPIKEWSTTQEDAYPIILGRSFLKAAHLFVNYNTNKFQIAQVAFTNDTQQIIDVPDSEEKLPGVGDDQGSDSGSPSSSNSIDKGKHLPSVPLLGGIAGVGAALVVALVTALFCLKKRKDRKKAKEYQERPNTGASDLPIGGRTELDSESIAMMKLSRSGTAASYANISGDHAELPEKDVRSIPPELPSNQHYESGKGTCLHELNTETGYHELPSAAHLINRAHAPYPGMHPSPPPPSQQQIPLPPTVMYPAGPMLPPPPGSLHDFAPPQYAAQQYSSPPSLVNPNSNPRVRTSLHELA